MALDSSWPPTCLKQDGWHRRALVVELLGGSCLTTHRAWRPGWLWPVDKSAPSILKAVFSPADKGNSSSFLRAARWIAKSSGSYPERPMEAPPRGDGEGSR
jgi:hypothetical protein